MESGEIDPASILHSQGLVSTVAINAVKEDVLGHPVDK